MTYKNSHLIKVINETTNNSMTPAVHKCKSHIDKCNYRYIFIKSFLARPPLPSTTQP